MKTFIFSLLWLSHFLLHSTAWAASPKTVVIKKETADFDLTISRSNLTNWLRPDVTIAVWGNQ